MSQLWSLTRGLANNILNYVICWSLSIFENKFYSDFFSSFIRFSMEESVNHVNHKNQFRPHTVPILTRRPWISLQVLFSLRNWSLFSFQYKGSTGREHTWRKSFDVINPFQFFPCRTQMNKNSLNRNRNIQILKFLQNIINRRNQSNNTPLLQESTGANEKRRISNIAYSS